MERGAAIVTGSTSGIGLGIARRLAASGYPILLNGLGATMAIRDLCQGLAKQFKILVVHDTADMRDPAAIEGLISHARRTFDRIDILFNNARIQFTAPVHKFPVEEWDKVITVNLSAAFHAIRIALQAMLASGTATIVNVASTHGLVASVDKAACVAAKHGLVGLTTVVALEAAGKGITCNAIYPDWVLTPLVERQIADHASAGGTSVEAATQALLAQKQSSGRFVTVEEIGELVVFLALPAADRLTGQALAVDGGRTAQ